MEVMDISEQGIKLLNEKKLKLCQSIHGEVVLLTGQTIRMDANVQWSLDNTVGNYNKAVGSFDAKLIPGAKKLVDLGINSGKDGPLAHKGSGKQREYSG